MVGRGQLDCLRWDLRSTAGDCTMQRKSAASSARCSSSSGLLWQCRERLQHHSGRSLLLPVAARQTDAEKSINTASESACFARRERNPIITLAAVVVCTTNTYSGDNARAETVCRGGDAREEETRRTLAAVVAQTTALTRHAKHNSLPPLSPLPAPIEIVHPSATYLLFSLYRPLLLFCPNILPVYQSLCRLDVSSSVAEPGISRDTTVFSKVTYSFQSRQSA